MKQKFTATLFAAVALSAATTPVVFAGGAHDHDPQYGGIRTGGKSFDAELVAKTDLITIYVSDHGKPMMSKGLKAKITLLNGAEKTEAELTAVGENKLEAKGTFVVAKGTKAVAIITPVGKSANTFRFEMK
jgi:hypothetical protein